MDKTICFSFSYIIPRACRIVVWAASPMPKGEQKCADKSGLKSISEPTNGGFEPKPLIQFSGYEHAQNFCHAVTAKILAVLQQE